MSSQIAHKATSLSRLTELEAVIERGVVDVGVALLEIRDGQLYKESHATFDDYCRERWGWSRIHAHRHIDTAKVAAVLPIGNNPANEAQARELVPLLREDEEQVAEVWEEIQAEHGEDITARDVREHVSKRLGRDPESPPAAVAAAVPQEEGDLFEILRCPHCGHEGERPEFRREKP